MIEESGSYTHLGFFFQSNHCLQIYDTNRTDKLTKSSLY